MSGLWLCLFYILSLTLADKTTFVNNAEPVIKEKMELTDSLEGLIASFSMIVVSEMGDKTFFIAAILAMNHSRVIVFCGALLALALMTILSVGCGWLAAFIPRSYTYYISTVLFAFFGIKMLIDGYKMSSSEGRNEFAEIQSKLNTKSEKQLLGKDVENEELKEKEKEEEEKEKEKEKENEKEIEIEKKNNPCTTVFQVLVQAFTLTFLAEWGDRSQVATIILAARESVYGVFVGGVIGHATCTCLAVVSGRIIAQKISVRSVTILGGAIFLLFALSSIFIDPDS